MISSRLQRIVRQITDQPVLISAGLTCFVAVFWALIEVLGGMIPARYSAYQTVWFRYATHLIFLVLVWGPRNRIGLIRTSRWKVQILRGLLMLGMPVCFILAAKNMPVNTVWSIFWFAPLISMGCAVILLKEKLFPSAWVAAVLCIAGTLMIYQPPLSGGWLNGFLALGMSLCFIFYILATRLLAYENTFTSLFYTAFAVLLPLSTYMPEVWQPLNWKVISAMVIIGLAGFGLLFALERALETAPVHLVAPFLYGAIFWYLLFREILHPISIGLLTLTGMLIILISNSILMYLHLRHPEGIIAAPPMQP